MRSTAFHPINLGLSNFCTYLLSTLFVVGNLILPQLCHLFPDGGRILLPIYFFTLIASYKFGIRIGLLTALLSPLCNSLLFGMPPEAVLPGIIVKSVLLAVFAAGIAHYSKKISLFHLVITVLAYQLTGGVVEYLLTDSLPIALQDLRLGVPGMIIQIIGGWFILKKLAEYDF